MAQEPVSVGGIWLRKQFAHLGNKIEVLAEVDGQWRLLGTWTSDDGCISHIVEPGGIRKAPPDADAEAHLAAERAWQSRRPLRRFHEGELPEAEKS